MTSELELEEYAERIHMEAELNEWIEHTVIQESLSNINQSEEDLLDYLMHFGVKGQKWGVRKARGDRSAFKKRAKANLPDLSKMSNEDLKAAVGRMQLEKQFRDLSKATQPKKAGVDFAKGILKDVGKQKAKEAIIAGIGAAVGGILFARSIMKD